MYTITISSSLALKLNTPGKSPKTWIANGMHHNFYLSKEDVPIRIGEGRLVLSLVDMYPSIFIDGEEVDYTNVIESNGNDFDYTVELDGAYKISYRRYNDCCTIDISHDNGDDIVTWRIIKIKDKRRGYSYRNP